MRHFCILHPTRYPGRQQNTSCASGRRLPPPCIPWFGLANDHGLRYGASLGWRFTVSGHQHRIERLRSTPWRLSFLLFCFFPTHRAAFSITHDTTVCILLLGHTSGKDREVCNLGLGGPSGQPRGPLPRGIGRLRGSGSVWDASRRSHGRVRWWEEKTKCVDNTARVGERGLLETRAVGRRLACFLAVTLLQT